MTTTDIEKIKSLRLKTGVSMQACKKALQESGGDEEKAIDILRKKGEAKAVDRAARTVSQGAVVIKSEGDKAAMVSLFCETDFVARGEDFLKLAETLADKLLKGKIKPGDKDLPEVKDAVLKLGENIQIGEMKLMEAKNLGQYVHSNRKIGALVSLAGGGPETAKDIAMQIAAANPLVIKPEDIAQSLIDKEKEIWTEQLKSEGKPEAIIAKIMTGKEKKFREENALLTQTFVKDPEKTIQKLLEEADSSIEDFARIAI